MRLCKECAAPLAADAPEGLCPKCLLKVGLGSEGSNPDDQTKKEKSAAPSPDELAKCFTQLQILELLGQGGMGMVYKARQPQLERLVALKILSPQLSRDPAFPERFTREARALARLNHPNIVGIYDFGKAGDFYYLIMEYVDGLNLWQMERARKPLAPEQALAIVPKICDALQYAHEEGIVHRDIKPGNILIDRKGRVKIADFGLAKVAGRPPKDSNLTQSKMTLGTPQYMAPEQLADPQKVDHRADIYSLGVVFYEMLTGELPMGRFALPSQKVQVDVRLDEIVLRALEREPERRYQHASQVRSDVESLSGVMEKPPPHLRQALGCEYRSKKTLFGLPLVHVTWGVDLATGKPKVARGILAVGPKALGIVAFGGMAVGIFDFGVLGIGLFSSAALCIGLLSVGGMVIGLLGAFGGVAVGPIALGGVAIGYHALGLGAAWGAQAVSPSYSDPVAERFFEPGVGPWLNHYVIIAFCLLLPPLAGGLGPSLLRRGLASGPPGQPWFSWAVGLAAAIGVAAVAPLAVAAAVLLLAVAGPVHPRYAPMGNPGAVTVLKSFAMDDKPISADLTLAQNNAWTATCTTTQTFRLFEVPHPGVEHCVVTYRARLKTQSLVGRAYLEMWCRSPAWGEAFSRGLDNVVTGSNDWATYQTPFFLKAGEKPDLIRLNLVVEGSGKIFIKDIELLAAPLN